MNNNKKRYVVSLDNLKARHLAMGVARDVSEKYFSTDNYIYPDESVINSVIAFDDGTCHIDVSTGKRSSIYIKMPANNDLLESRIMTVNVIIWTQSWEVMLDDYFYYDYDQFMADYMKPYDEAIDKQKED